MNKILLEVSLINIRFILLRFSNRSCDFQEKSTAKIFQTSKIVKMSNRNN